LSAGSSQRHFGIAALIINAIVHKNPCPSVDVGTRPYQLKNLCSSVAKNRLPVSPVCVNLINLRYLRLSKPRQPAGIFHGAGDGQPAHLRIYYRENLAGWFRIGLQKPHLAPGIDNEIQSQLAQINCIPIQGARNLQGQVFDVLPDSSDTLIGPAQVAQGLLQPFRLSAGGHIGGDPAPGSHANRYTADMPFIITVFLYHYPQIKMPVISGSLDALLD